MNTINASSTHGIISNVAGVTMDQQRQSLLSILFSALKSGGNITDYIIDIEHEAENEYDHNACVVKIFSAKHKKYYILGYVPKTLAVDIVRLVDDDLIETVQLCTVGYFTDDVGKDIFYCIIDIVPRGV